MADYRQQQFDQKDTTFCKAYQKDYGEEIYKIWSKDYCPDPLMSVFFGYNDMDNCMSWYLAQCMDGTVRSQFKKENPDPAELTKIVKEVAKYLGAEMVGICELSPHHVYSHKAQKIDMIEGEWGKPTDILERHKYAISLAFPMKRELIKLSPSYADEAEIGHAYHKAAVLSSQLAAFIRECGYSAQGHQHRRDYVIHVPIAVDAGLGECGRLGYLITPEYGPCVRLTTVTTDMPLVPDKPVDYGINKFCEICKKCAKNCPSKSIPMGDKEEVRGYKKWQLDADKCFKFWLSNPDKYFGCAVCMKTCPWNQPNTWYHHLATKMVKHIPWTGHILLWMDDLIHGKHPVYKHKWIDFSAVIRDVKDINAKGGADYINSKRKDSV